MLKNCEKQDWLVRRSFQEQDFMLQINIDGQDYCKQGPSELWNELVLHNRREAARSQTA